MKIAEIFQSIDGEGPRAGKLANFIRLAGCNLRCSYCDTGYALSAQSGTEQSLDEIIHQLDPNFPNVTITGGEPCLSYDSISPLLSRLLELDYLPSIETNGSIDLRPFIANFPQVQYIVDYKSPSSSMNDQMNVNAFSPLNSGDIVKFVVGSVEDLKAMHRFYENTIRLLRELPQLYVSPILGKIELEAIVNYMKKHQLIHFRLQLQLHKIIWNADKKGV